MGKNLRDMSEEEFEKAIQEHISKFGNDIAHKEARDRRRLAYTYTQDGVCCPSCDYHEWDTNSGFISLLILGSEYQGFCWFECHACGSYSPPDLTREGAFSKWEKDTSLVMPGNFKKSAKRR